MGAEADFLHFMLAVSLVFLNENVQLLIVFSFRPPNVVSTLAFPLAAERCFFILIAALRSVSLRLQSLNQKTLTEHHGFSTESFTRIRFLIFYF